MRYQEKIHNRTGVCVRNKDQFNVSMSSDICIFNAPLFGMVGAGKIGSLSASTGTYIINGETDINLTFEFNHGIESLTGNTTFKFEVYKYNKKWGVFNQPAIYKSKEYTHTEFTNPSAITTTIPINDLKLDGEYLVKGYYKHGLCTDILGRLDLTNDTSNYKNGAEYGMYNQSKDYYFVAMTEAQTPIIGGGDNSDDRVLGGLVARTVIPDVGSTNFIVDGNVSGALLVYLNGLLLAKRLDYNISGNVIELSGETIEGDVITYVSVKDGEAEGLVVDNIYVDGLIPNGPTDGEGDNTYYYNTTHNKYEVYVEFTPSNSNDIVVTLNGVTLANNIDYYQSITNPKRIILEGDLLNGDVINIIYNAYPQYVGGIYTNTPRIFWSIGIAPQLNNGIFTVQVATDSTFTNIVSSATTEYLVNVNAYSADVLITGDVGTNLVYRILNDKNFETINDGIINSRAESEIIPITIMSNAINSY